MDNIVGGIKISNHHHYEHYNRNILYKDIVEVCLSVRVREGHAESIARKVCDEVDEWLAQHPEVTSHDIRTVATKCLRRHHPEAAYIYESQRNTI